jgi:hypothetical protein
MAWKRPEISKYEKRPGKAGPKGKEVAIPTEIRFVVQWVQIPPGQSRARQAGSKALRWTRQLVRRCVGLRTSEPRGDGHET